MPTFVAKDVKTAQVRPLIANASKIIKDYTAILIFEDGRVGSGVFVNTRGVEGILTAHHVAQAILRFSEFGLCIAEHPHAVWVRSELLEHIVIGNSSDNPERKNGPDLSLIAIRNSNLLETVRSLKSFCFLESQKTSFFDGPLHGRHWVIAGSPYEFCSPVKGGDKGSPLTKLKNFVGDADFHSRRERDGFDYVDLLVTSGQGEFPKSYAGVSGGGFWMIPLEIDPNQDVNTIRNAAPLLAGIAFYESEPNNGVRIITGHGFNSIYSCVSKALGPK